MATVPDYSHVVRDLAATFGPLDTHDRSGAFTELAAAVLHSHDPNFGHLRKFGSQNQYNGHAVDAVLYKATGQAIDLIIGSAEPGARVGWGVEEIPRYTDAEKYWMAPMGLPPGDEDEEPQQPPAHPPEAPWLDILDEMEGLRADFAAESLAREKRDEMIIAVLGRLENSARQPRAIEMKVPAFGGTARGTLKPAAE